MSHIFYIPTYPARCNAAYNSSPGGRRFLDTYAALHKDEIKYALGWWKEYGATSVPGVGFTPKILKQDSYSMGLYTVYSNEKYWTVDCKHKSPDLDCKITQDAIFDFLEEDDIKLVNKTEQKYPQSEVSSELGLYIILCPGRSKIIEDWYGFNFAARTFQGRVKRYEWVIVYRTLVRKNLSVCYHSIEYECHHFTGCTSKFLGFNESCPIIEKFPYDETKMLRFQDVKVDESTLTLTITKRRWGSAHGFKYVLVAGKGRVFQVEGTVPGIPNLKLILT